MTLPSSFDNTHFPLSRNFISQMRQLFVQEFLKKTDTICDIGNQGKELPELENYNIVTLDITDETGPDVVADITRYNQNIPTNFFDALMCTDVLEHVVDPFYAIKELNRIVKVGGFILFTTPLNIRIHGPVPDCWRFTEFGLKVLLRDFEIKVFKKLDTPDRNLFPLHYGAIVRKINDTAVETDPRLMHFQKVD